MRYAKDWRSLDKDLRMNTNELADELEGFGYLNSDDGLHFCPFQAQVNMLRQQQAEIEALKLQLHTTLTSRNLEKPAKYSDAWWKEVAEFNKARKAQK